MDEGIIPLRTERGVPLRFSSKVERGRRPRKDGECPAPSKDGECRQ